MAEFTKEQLQKIIAAADDVLTALAGTNDDIHHESDAMLRAWDDLNDRYAPPRVVAAMARQLLAGLEQEPVGWMTDVEVDELHRGLAEEAYIYRIADCASTIPLYAAPQLPQPAVPETLPCPVMLEPGLRFGKGVRTQTMLDALQRRAEFYAELEAMTPEQRADHEAGMKEFAAMLQGAEPREHVRREHAEWSQSTFGNVGPVGPLKHLSIEALETADDVSDLSEWADMQFLLWDAQRRAGITDEQITVAMFEKLAVNKARTWPEPKDGEPRLHIKAAPQQELKSALEMGMARYGEAMQKLADGGD